MTSSIQPSSLDNHLNESLLIEDERINTHHTADLYEHNDVFLQEFCQDVHEQTKNRNENQSYPDLQSNKQHQRENEFIHSTVPYYTLDEEIQLTISDINELSKQNDELPMQELEDKLRSLQEIRETLPIYQFRTELMEAIRDHQVLIIQGEAGSGKTTQLPQYLYEIGYCEINTNEDDEAKFDDTKNQTRKKMIIACAQPNSMSALSIAAHVAKEMNVKLGDKVGYSTRFQSCSSNQTIIKYITDKMLLKEFLVEPDFASYNVLIINQADERTIHTDILHGLVKDILRIRPSFKLLISLTTIAEAMKFSRFFNDAPIFVIPGRRFPVDIYYTKVFKVNYINVSVQTVLQIHTTQPSGDILVCLTSQEEIEMVIDRLCEQTRKLDFNDQQLIILSIYSTLSSDIKARIAEPTPAGTRKVVLVANIAEASLAIDSIRYVVDSGFCKEKTSNTQNGIESLMLKPISRALANQRAGQAGRIAPGKCFRLYTGKFESFSVELKVKHPFYLVRTYQDELNDNSLPEIQRTNLANVILLLKSLGVNDPFTFDYIDPPSMDKLHLAFEQLYAFGVFNEQNELTELGHRIIELPLDLMISKTILASETYKCSAEILTIISMLFVNNSIFYRSKGTTSSVEIIPRIFSSSDGDHLMLLNIYNQWKNINYSTEWCLENSIQFQSMNRARQIRDQLENLIKSVGIQIHSNPNDSINIRKSICAGFFSHTAKSVGNGIYKSICHQQNVYIDPDSCLFDQLPSYIIYFELIRATKEYMRQIIRIEKEWLHETASYFYETNVKNEDEK